MIEVLQNYGGLNTGWARIVPGLYAEDAPALFGLASFLVSAGIARRVVVDAPAVPDPEPAVTPDPEPDAPKPVTRRKKAVGDE
jgi:hypothetical protein